MSTPRIWLITGANKGLGLELTLVALSHGERVVAAVRTPSAVPEVLKNNPDVVVILFNLVWDQARMDGFVTEAVKAFGRVDVLVNMAGYCYAGGVEESTDEATNLQFNHNVFAPTRLIRSLLPTLRAQQTGTIVNLSSVGGLHSYPGNSIYCATKFALEAITFALAEEIASFGLRAMVVQPGYFRTGFLDNIDLAEGMKVYEGTVMGKAREDIKKFNGRQPGDPRLGALRMWEGITGEGLAKGKKLLLRIPLGNDTGTMMRIKGKELLATADEWEDVWSTTDFVE